MYRQADHGEAFWAKASRISCEVSGMAQLPIRHFSPQMLIRSGSGLSAAGKGAEGQGVRYDGDVGIEVVDGR